MDTLDNSASLSDGAQYRIPSSVLGDHVILFIMFLILEGDRDRVSMRDIGVQVFQYVSLHEEADVPQGEDFCSLYSCCFVVLT